MPQLSARRCGARAYSYLIPVSTLLRALVLEKEAKLREQLLTMGATLRAYYGAVLTTYGLTYLIAGAVCAGIVGSSCLTSSSPSLVVLLFALFTLASLAFTLALSPFFTDARVAALAGPLLFFITSMLYFLFLEDGQARLLPSASGCFRVLPSASECF